MSKFYCLFLLTVVMLQVSRACEGRNHEELKFAAARQQTENYFAYAYGYTPNLWNSLFYRSNLRYVPAVYASPYEGRTPAIPESRTNPNKNNFASSREDDEGEKTDDKEESRFAIGLAENYLSNRPVEFNSGLSTNNPWGEKIKNVLNLGPISVNPNVNYQVASFDSCTSRNGDAGICASRAVCSLFGGRSSGTCLLGLTCCVNAINTCNGAITLNNTYWQSPATTISAPSTCSLTVTLDNKRREQIKPICQVRLDFVTFTTAQPTAGNCVDTFEVGGSSNVAPVICGDNSGQHMYLDVQSSAISSTDLNLKFNFAAGIGTYPYLPRSWNIKIAMLPCGANYLAPRDCLQYFTSSSGRVSSFNWQDVASTATRQLNNQNYRICFRTELIKAHPTKATQMCLSVCSVTNGGDAFSITTVQPGGTDVAQNSATLINFAATLSAVGTTYRDTQQGTTAVCLYDFLLIAGGRDSTNVEADRYCGNALNPAAIGGPKIPPLNDPAPGGSAQSVQVCSAIVPFRLIYRTDGTEGAVTAVAASNVIGASADTANTGFCLDFQEK
ncbi:uncharacterized protein LOC124316227 [Daphnia pulicaria]|uniref:uncharacterized protein LOC124316227 n=1 Tax=Daphnia pulicaria TaxID=35523 RepID=UPI001EEAD963|nr:uncharacterized protein LOC124316227 [Daphnia pulicaria]